MNDSKISKNPQRFFEYGKIPKIFIKNEDYSENLPL